MASSGAHVSAGVPRILILALNGLEFDRRVESEARLLSGRGFDVTRVGILAQDGQSELEETDCGRIVRLHPAWHSPTPLEQATGPGDSSQAAHRAAAPLVRQWKLKVWLMTRLRGLWSPIKESNARIKVWARWNDAYFAGCQELRPDAVIACDLDTLDAGVRLKEEFGCPLVYDMHELWTEQRYHHYLTSYHKWLMRRRETRLLARADMVTTVSKRFAADIQRRLSSVEPLVVYTGTQHCSPSAPRSSGQLRLFFQGSFTDDRGLEDIVEAIVHVRGKAHLTLQGFGRLEGELKRQIASLGLSEDDVRFIAPCVPSDVGMCASGYDVGIVAGRLKSLNARLTTPNRPFAYAAGGLAMITPANLEEIAELVNEYECGMVVEEGDAKSLADAIMYLVDNSDVLARMKANAHDACQAFRWERQFGPVADFIQGSPKTCWDR